MDPKNSVIMRFQYFVRCDTVTVSPKWPNQINEIIIIIINQLEILDMASRIWI